MKVLSNIATWKIFFIILLEGFVTISLEILVIRQLIPEVGNSVITTSLIIGIFLLCLAYGYRAGGRQKTDLFKSLCRNFFIAAIGIGLGLSYLLISSFFWVVNVYAHIPVLITLVIYLCLIIAPIVYFLGQTVPITMHLLQQDETAGSLGGRVLHLSTIGSFLGSVFTALILMNFLGVAWTIMVNVFVLSALILIISKHKHLVSLLVINALIYFANQIVGQTLFITTTPYANYSIVNDVTTPNVKEPGTVLSINNSYSSFIDKDKQGFMYIERIKAILFQELGLRNKNILVLGAGGFTLSAQGTYTNHITYVDIDPKIYPLVQKHFLNPIHGDFVAIDARQYVRQHPDSYDAIVTDAYSNRMSIPTQLLTQEFFEDIKAALRPNGVAIFNVVAPALLNTPYAQRVDNTLRSVFGHCSATPIVFNPKGLSNIIYVCANIQNSDDKTLYTDNLNRASLDTFDNLKN